MGHPAAAIAQRRSKGPVRQNQDALYPFAEPPQQAFGVRMSHGPLYDETGRAEHTTPLDSPLPHVDLYYPHVQVGTYLRS
jgi:hypothetical protein